MVSARGEENYTSEETETLASLKNGLCESRRKLYFCLFEIKYSLCERRRVREFSKFDNTVHAVSSIGGGFGSALIV
jgi:hypothetical protein